MVQMVAGAGTAFGSPLLESKRGSKYGYRHRMGLVPCAEFDVFHDGFHIVTGKQIGRAHV